MISRDTTSGATFSANFGELRNIDLDVEVVRGSGIISVLQSLDNGSDDGIVR